MMTQWLSDFHGVRMDYDVIAAQGFDSAPYWLLEGSRFMNSAPYRILEGSRYMISAPYRILEGSGCP